MDLTVLFKILQEFFHSHVLFSMGLLLIVGYLLGYLMMKIKMPEITGFIIAGLLIGPFFGGMVSHHQTENSRSSPRLPWESSP
jgi:predicted Kef-type K+ transport protein